MAYTYSDYITYEESDPATYRSRLRLHIQEVSDLIGPDVAGADMSVQRNALITYRDSLMASLKEAKADPAARINGGLSYARVRDPR